MNKNYVYAILICLLTGLTIAVLIAGPVEDVSSPTPNVENGKAPIAGLAQNAPKETAHSSGSWSSRPVEITVALSMTFCNSLTLPGHS